MTAEEKAADEAVDMTNCSLSKIILEHMDINKERDDRKREEKEEQEGEKEDEEEQEELKEGLRSEKRRSWACSRYDL